MKISTWLTVAPMSLAALMITLPAAASASAVTPAQKSTICGARSTCTIGKVYDGGKSLAGAALEVAEVHLGLKDKPDDAPDSGCQAGDKFDGGVEYWLIEGTQPPRRILKLCNDGYGAAGIGEDEVTVGPNLLVHREIGGSSDRWESTVRFTLSPFRAVAERDCNYNNLSAGNGTLTDLDFLKMTARSVTKDTAAKWGEDVGCPQWPSAASAHFTPQPASNLLGGYNVIVPVLPGGPVPAPKLPTGAAIGDCIAPMTTSGVNGFVIFGAPAAASQAAEIKVMAESSQALVIQVYDSAAADQPAKPKGSWINLPHAEVWVALSNTGANVRLPANQLTQVGVDLNGKAYAGVGKKEALPAVERWQAHDAGGRPVVVLRLTWSSDTEFANGVAVVYSQAEGGKQARLVATTGIVKNHPLFAPGITSLPNSDVSPQPGRCSVRNGLLSLGS